MEDCKLFQQMKHCAILIADKCFVDSYRSVEVYDGLINKYGKDKVSWFYDKLMNR